MRKTIFIILASVLALGIKGQEKVKQKELGFAFTSLNNFGLTYKTGTNKAKWRFSSLVASGNSAENKNDDLNEKNSNLGFELKAGREGILPIGEKMEFCLGAELGFGYSKGEMFREYVSSPSSYRDINYSSFQTGINLVLGFNYVIKEKLVLGVSLYPGYRQMNREDIEKDINDVEVKTTRTFSNFGFSNSGAELLIAVRF